MKWQPIETAPAGEWLLVWDAYGSGKHVIARCDYGFWTASHPVGRDISDDCRCPTHWMHLPEPPEADHA